jgi:hypothetical protein
MNSKGFVQRKTLHNPLRMKRIQNQFILSWNESIRTLCDPSAEA